ncbi:hypothetical protein HKBW3S03_01568, partial [Candidatus Hakubella thermalkaliphila]
MIDKELLDILACPKCKGDLKLTQVPQNPAFWGIFWGRK